MASHVAELEKTRPCSNPPCENFADKSCSRCGQAKYCSKQCQLDHRPEHRSHCRPNTGLGPYVVLAPPIFRDVIERLDRGELAQVFGRDPSSLQVVVRKTSGRLFERGTGKAIYELDAPEGLESNWARLLFRCGNSVMQTEDEALFLDSSCETAFWLDRRTDRVEELPVQKSKETGMLTVVQHVKTVQR